MTISLLLLCIFASGQNTSVADTLAKKWKVRTAIMKTYFGNSKSPSMTYTEFYDSDGKMIKRTSFNNHLNTLSIKEYFFYNGKGQLLKEQDIHYNKKDSLVDIQTYSYNSTGLLSRNFNGEIKYRYDRNGRVIERIEQTAKSGSLKTIYAYDSSARLILEKKHLFNYKIQIRTIGYNIKGYIDKEIISYYDSQEAEDFATSEYEHTFIYTEKGLREAEYQKQTSGSPRSADRIYTYEYTFY
ncbi:MAG: hypothetical protein V4651_07270 [Bacteroidota bacterium]